MTVLMKNKEGHVCDSRCYCAKGPICNCICGGVNHGVGYEQAVENCRKILNVALTYEEGSVLEEVNEDE